MYKLMVIDDEQIIREGIINTINNHNIGFEVAGEAANGKQALAMIPEIVPDVLLTDICMPILNGLEFIEAAKSINPDIQVVIVSGYDDFEFARNALRLGVYEYILKPVQSDKLLDILAKVQEQLDRRSGFLRDLDELKKQIKVSLPVLRERFLDELLHGKVKEGELEQKLNDLDLPVTGKFFSVALLKIKNFESLNPQFAREDGLFEAYLIQLTENIFPVEIRPLSFFIDSDKMAILLGIRDGDQQKAFISLNQNLKRILIAVQRSLNVEVYASLGKMYDDLLLVCQSYQEAEEALQFILLQEKGILVNYEDINTKKEVPWQRPVELEKQLVMQIKIGEKQHVQQTMARLLGHYRELKDWEPSRIKLLIFEIIVLLIRTVEEMGGYFKNVMKDEKCSPYEYIHRCETLTDMQQFLSTFVINCVEEIERVRVGKGYTLVEKAKEIMEASLEQREFSLDDVAARLYISPNYLRTLFKQQVGESFVEYLTRIRMEKALKLLDDVTLKVHQIAERVGYIDQHYFSICFKKYYGLTPTEYREVKISTENRG